MSELEPAKKKAKCKQQHKCSICFSTFYSKWDCDKHITTKHRGHGNGKSICVKQTGMKYSKISTVFKKKDNREIASTSVISANQSATSVTSVPVSMPMSASDSNLNLTSETNTTDQIQAIRTIIKEVITEYKDKETSQTSAPNSTEINKFVVKSPTCSTPRSNIKSLDDILSMFPNIVIKPGEDMLVCKVCFDVSSRRKYNHGAATGTASVGQFSTDRQTYQIVNAIKTHLTTNYHNLCSDILDREKKEIIRLDSTKMTVARVWLNTAQEGDGGLRSERSLALTSFMTNIGDIGHSKRKYNDFIEHAYNLAVSDVKSHFTTLNKKNK